MNNVKKITVIVALLVASVVVGWLVFTYLKKQTIKKAKLEALRVGTGPVDSLLKVG